MQLIATVFLFVLVVLVICAILGALTAAAICGGVLGACAIVMMLVFIWDI